MVITSGRDQQRWCRDCGRSFVWTAQAQADYARLSVRTGRAFHPPSRCKQCRRLDRAWRHAEARRGDDDIAAVSTDGEVVTE